MTKIEKKQTPTKKKKRMVAGWREWLSIPGLDIRAIKVKLDTGARTSALHATRIKPFQRDGEDWIKFQINPVQRGRKYTIDCEAKVLNQRRVRSSSGQAEERYVIKTAVHLGGRKRTIEITLTNRDQMGFRMLLGRSAMNRWLVVDPSKSFIQGEKPPLVKKHQARGETES